jgi:hypothetical protein
MWHADYLEIVRPKHTEYALAVRGELAPRTAAAARPVLGDLEIDVLGEAFDQLPAFREGGATGKGRHHAGGVDRRDHANHTDDMPILFDKARFAPQIGSDALNQDGIQNPLTQRKSRHTRSCGALACSPQSHGPTALASCGPRCRHPRDALAQSQCRAGPATAFARKPLCGIGRLVGRRRDGSRIKPLSHPYQPTLSHKHAQRLANLVVICEILEIGAEKHVASLAGDPL